MLRRKIFLVTIGMFIFNQSLFAGAWTQKQGHYYFKFSINRFNSTSQYFLNGDREPLADNGNVTDLSAFGYLEYGLFDDLTFITAVPFKRINFSCAIEGCNDTSSGIGDLWTGLRYRLSNSLWKVAVQTDLKISSGYETEELKLDSAPPLGDGQTDFDLRLLIGRSIFNYSGYINLDIGFRTRSGEPVDEVPYAFELGINLTKNYMLIGQIHGVRSISENANQNDFRIIDGKVQNFVGTGALEDFVKGQLQLIYKISPKFDLTFDFDQVLSGRNTSYSTTLGAGLVLHN